MPLTAMDHFFVRAKDLEQSRRFYVDTLGFEEMPRPPIPFPGYWLGVNGQVQIHMGPASLPGQELFYASDPARALDGQSGVIDHVAFRASDPRAVRARIAACGVPCRRRAYPEARIWQILVEDPNGITIELNFTGIDPAEWDAD